MENKQKTRESNQTPVLLANDEVQNDPKSRIAATFTSQGSNVQQGSNNTMIIQRNLHFCANLSKPWLMGFAAIIVFSAILIPQGIEFWSRHHSVTSLSLPRTDPDFVGRKKEVERICQLLSFLGPTGSNSENPNIVNIIGAPGFGKSALAIAVGNELLKCGVRVHYVDLSGVKTAKDAIARILPRVTDKLELINNSDYTLWASSIYANTVLILDNCNGLMEDEESIRNSFLNILSKMSSMNHSLRLLTTARYDYTVLDVKSVPFLVKELSTESATQLLFKISPHTNSSATALFANLTGKVALAVKIVGALLKEGETEDRLADELFRSPIEALSPNDFRPEERIRVVIASSFRRLSGYFKRSLAILACMPGSFDENGAAAVLNVTTTAVRKQCLKRITRRCLLESNDHSKRYHIHTLIHAFVKEDLGIHVDGNLFRHRFFRHYFQRLLDLAEKFDNNPRDVLRSYDYDQHNFYQVLVYCMNSHLVSVADETIRESVVRLAEQAADLFTVRLSGSQLFRWYRHALYYAADLTDDRNKKKYCNILLLLVSAATMHVNKNRNITVILERETILVHQCSTEVRFRMIERICFSRYELHVDIPDNVLNCYHTYAQLLRLPVSDARNFWWLGHQFYKHGIDNAAVACFMKTGLHFEDINLRDQVIYLQSAAKVFSKNGQKKEEAMARMSLSKLDIHRFLRYQDYSTFVDTGMLHLRMNEPAIALLYFDFAYIGIKDLLSKDDEKLLRFHFLRGKAFFALHIYQNATEHFEKVVVLSRKLYGNDSVTATFIEELGDSLDKLGLENAVGHWIEAATILEKFPKEKYKVFLLFLKIGKWQMLNNYLFSGAKYYNKAYKMIHELEETNEHVPTIPTSSTTDIQSLPPTITIFSVVNLVKTLLELYLGPSPDQSNDPGMEFCMSLFETAKCYVLEHFISCILVLVLVFCGYIRICYCR